MPAPNTNMRRCLMDRRGTKDVQSIGLESGAIDSEIDSSPQSASYTGQRWRTALEDGIGGLYDGYYASVLQLILSGDKLSLLAKRRSFIWNVRLTVGDKPVNSHI